MIDLGAASSNPDTTEVGVVEEIKRLKPVIKALKEKGIYFVDTFKPEVQSFCIEQKVDFINDIQGFPYPEIYSGLAKSDCKLVLMHPFSELVQLQKVETNPKRFLLP